MDIRRVHLDGFGDDFIDEADDGRFVLRDGFVKIFDFLVAERVIRGFAHHAAFLRQLHDLPRADTVDFLQHRIDFVRRRENRIQSCAQNETQIFAFLHLRRIRERAAQRAAFQRNRNELEMQRDLRGNLLDGRLGNLRLAQNDEREAARQAQRPVDRLLRRKP